MKYHSNKEQLHPIACLGSWVPTEFFLKNVRTSVELDKLQEFDEKIPRALNYLGFRIVFKYSLHRVRKVFINHLPHIAFFQTIKHVFVESDGINVLHEYCLSYKYPQHHRKTQ